MKSVGDGTKLNERFRSDEKLEKAHVEPRQMQYLYPDGSQFVFMDLQTYEQLYLDNDSISEQVGYLQPNLEVQLNFYNDNPIGMELPSAVALEVTDTETVVKGQTASGSGKPATLETGLRVTVPPFVNIGDVVRVNTDTGEYIERACIPFGLSKIAVILFCQTRQKHLQRFNIYRLIRYPSGKPHQSI